MNPALRSAEEFFRHFFVYSYNGEDPPALVSTLFECSPHGTISTAFRFDDGSTSRWCLSYDQAREMEGWPWPSLPDFTEIYYRYAPRVPRRGHAFNGLVPIDVQRDIGERYNGMGYGGRPTVEFRGVPIVARDDLVHREIDILPGHINYVTASEVCARPVEAMFRLLSAENDWLEGMRQQIGSTMLYGSEPPDPAAAGRAEALLREWLSPQQTEELDARGYFHVVGSESGKRYRIKRGRSMNVIELGGDGDPLVGRCFVPQGRLAAGDIMLGQKIALETQERKALAKANAFPVIEGSGYGSEGSGYGSGGITLIGGANDTQAIWARQRAVFHQETGRAQAAAEAAAARFAAAVVSSAAGLISSVVALCILLAVSFLLS